MPTEVAIPRYFNSNTMYALLSKIVGENRQPTDSTLVFDFRKLEFIEPEGYVVLANLIEWIVLNNSEYRFICPPTGQSRAVSYLDDSRFFSEYLGEPLDNSSNSRSTTIPLQRVAYQESYGWVENKFVPWLSNRLNMTEASFSSIKACLVEIFNNIDDHAGSDVEVGCFFAQHYPNKDRVQVAVSDFGKGIPSNVRKVEQTQLGDGQAIMRATENGFTSKSQPANRGAGLNTLLCEVIDNNGGELHIYSDRGAVSCIGDRSQGARRTPKETTGVYPGTLISISFRTDTIENIPEEEFLW
jgi:anti-sigma regulatory factor (Ser/Thr protein kinase)